MKSHPSSVMLLISMVNVVFGADGSSFLFLHDTAPKRIRAAAKMEKIFFMLIVVLRVNTMRMAKA